MTVLLRASIFHTPGNPFRELNVLQHFSDGALLIQDGRIAACGPYSEVSAAHPAVQVRDLRGGYLLPGFVDTHVHFPQVRALGGLGRHLLDWLQHIALPEETRMADPVYAADTARRFVHALAASGTTTSLVFGSHFASATAALFQEASRVGLRIVSGLVVSDRLLHPDLHRTPQQAHRNSTELIHQFHGHGRLLYAVTPRFAYSASEAMLEVCQSLMQEHSGLRFQTHLNENALEIAEVARLFPWSQDYLAVYERFGLAGRGAVMAHNVHPTDSELQRMGAAGTAVSHCPCSNALLGSGLFPMHRHLLAGVPFALGTDVGGGAGFGILKEALQAYSLQRIAPGGLMLEASHLLYLATLAGAEALLLEQETGDFRPGKSADFVYLKPPAGSLLEGVLERAESPSRILAAIFTLGGPADIQEVCVAGTALV